MIYLDSSVVLAELLTENRRPSPSIGDEDLVTSRLLEYEVWVRLHDRGLGFVLRRPPAGCSAGWHSSSWIRPSSNGLFTHSR